MYKVKAMAAHILGILDPNTSYIQSFVMPFLWELLKFQGIRVYGKWIKIMVSAFLLIPGIY